MAKVKRYDSGLKIIVENMPSVLSVSVGILVGAGSCLETEKNNGISHFIEHTTFKGTKRFSSVGLSEAFDDVGAQVNAFTSKEMTCYYVKTTKHALERSVDLLSDMFLNSVYDEDELNREKGVIIEEINMSDDTPEDVCLDVLSESFFGKNGLGQTILGTRENIKKFDKTYVEEFRKAYYNADNVVVSFAGNITLEEAELLTERYFEPFVSREKSNSLIINQESNLGGRIARNKEIEQLHLALGFTGVKYDAETADESAAFNVALGSGMSSRLFQTVREKNGLCYAVYSYTAGFLDCGMFAVSAAVGRETEQRALALIRDELDRFRTDGVTQSELDRAREQVHASVLMAEESTAARMNKLGYSELYLGRVLSADEVLARYDAVTCEDILGLARETLDFARVSFSAVGRLRAQEEYEQLLKG